MVRARGRVRVSRLRALDDGVPPRPRRLDAIRAVAAAEANLSKARLARVSSRASYSRVSSRAWDPACSSGVGALCVAYLEHRVGLSDLQRVDAAHLAR